MNHLFDSGAYASPNKIRAFSISKGMCIPLRMEKNISQKKISTFNGTQNGFQLLWPNI